MKKWPPKTIKVNYNEWERLCFLLEDGESHRVSDNIVIYKSQDSKWVVCLKGEYIPANLPRFESALKAIRWVNSNKGKREIKRIKEIAGVR